jgi:hypothetical protein
VKTTRQQRDSFGHGGVVRRRRSRSALPHTLHWIQTREITLTRCSIERPAPGRDPFSVFRINSWFLWRAESRLLTTHTLPQGVLYSHKPVFLLTRSCHYLSPYYSHGRSTDRKPHTESLLLSTLGFLIPSHQ